MPRLSPEDVGVIELFEFAKKAGDAAVGDDISSNGPEVGRCVDALKQLGNYPITYEILVSSQVGKRLRALTKHPVDQVQTVASDLLESWKQLVVNETTKRKQAEKSPTASAVKVEKTSTNGAVKVEKAKSSSNGAIKVENRAGPDIVKVEKTIVEEIKSHHANKPPRPAAIAPPKLSSLVRCNDPMRDKVRELLAEALAKVVGEVDDDDDITREVGARDPIRVAVSVESAMFDKLGKSNGGQKLKYRSIMFNIKDPKNPDLRRKVLLGQINPERLMTMTPEEMASEERQMENKQMRDKALFECERGGPPQATTDQFRCGRCRQKKCTYYQMQTRSADEPMTTYVTCVNCSNRWKFC
ncbi:unnamed protein product [Linum tenue]|uniref:Transcription elongation factor n=1 Tax=Linum tenue TaxID=586396 RepID=A0AAV0PWH5_9ROSI|nr:unnamed protein product [Linum tenue]